jgi:fucose permease
MPASQGLIITTISGALLVGLVLPLLGSLRRPLARHLGRDERQTRGLWLVFAVTLLPLMLVAGLLVDRWGPRDGLILGSLATAVALAALSLSRTYGRALASAALLAAALAVLHTATAVLLPAAFVAPGRPTTSTNLGYLFVGVSTLAMSAVLPLLERRLGLREGLLILALVSLVPAAAAGFTPAGDFPAPERTAETAAVVSDPWLWLAGLVLFLYYPLENVLTAWAPAYLAEVGRTPRSIPVGLAGYWIAFLSTRFLTALAPAELVPWLTLLLMLLAAATVGNLSGSYRPVAGTTGVWVLGACLGPIFPSLVGLVFQRFPEHQALAFGLLLALGGSGGLVLQPALEHYARGHPVRFTMRLVMLVALVLAAPALVLCLLGFAH